MKGVGRGGGRTNGLQPGQPSIVGLVGRRGIGRVRCRQNSMLCRWIHISPTSFARDPRCFQISAARRGGCRGTYVIPAYRTSTQIFVLQMARIMECSET